MCVDSVGEEVAVVAIFSSSPWIGQGAARKNDDAWEWDRTGNGRLGSGRGAGREVGPCAGKSCIFNAGVACAEASVDFDIDGDAS